MRIPAPLLLGAMLLAACSNSVTIDPPLRADVELDEDGKSIVAFTVPGARLTRVR